MKKLKKLVVGVLLLSMALGLTVSAKGSRMGIVYSDRETLFTGTTGDGRQTHMYAMLSEASEMADVDTVKALTGWDNFTIQFFDYKLYEREPGGYLDKDGNLVSQRDPSILKEVDSLAEPVTIPIFFTWNYPGEKEGEEVKVICLNNGNWELLASGQAEKIECAEGTPTGINVAWPVVSSSAAFIVKTDGNASVDDSSSDESSGSNSGSSSGGGSHSSSNDSDSESDGTPFVNPVTIPDSGSVSFESDGIPYRARLLAGPTTRTFSVTDAQTMLGASGYCSVYLMDIWLENQDNPGEVLTLGEEGAVLSFNVPNVNPNCKVKIRHWLNGTDEYEDLTPTEIGNGYIKVKFTSLSPIAICVEEAPAPAEGTSASTGGTSASTGGTSAATEGTSQVSPKTGEGSMIYLAEVMAAAALLGFAVYRRRRAER